MVRPLLCDFSFFPDDASPPPMLFDRAPAMALSQGPTYRSCTKHIYFTMALARDYIQVQRGRAVMEHYPTALLICGQATWPFCWLPKWFHGACSFLAFLVWCWFSIVTSGFNCWQWCESRFNRKMGTCTGSDHFDLGYTSLIWSNCDVTMWIGIIFAPKTRSWSGLMLDWSELRNEISFW
jgi:hypothetical protein